MGHYPDRLFTYEFMPSGLNLFLLRVACLDKAANLPIIVMMHGFRRWGGRDRTVHLSAGSGAWCFCLAPGMRGRNSATGVRIALGGIFEDIYEVIYMCGLMYAIYLDAKYVTIAG